MDGDTAPGVAGSDPNQNDNNDTNMGQTDNPVEDFNSNQDASNNQESTSTIESSDTTVEVSTDSSNENLAEPSEQPAQSMDEPVIAGPAAKQPDDQFTIDSSEPMGKKTSKTSKTGLIVGIILGALVLLGGVFAAIYFLFMAKIDYKTSYESVDVVASKWNEFSEKWADVSPGISDLNGLDIEESSLESAKTAYTAYTNVVKELEDSPAIKDEAVKAKYDELKNANSEFSVSFDRIELATNTMLAMEDIDLEEEGISVVEEALKPLTESEDETLVEFADIILEFAELALEMESMEISIDSDDSSSISSEDQAALYLKLMEIITTMSELSTKMTTEASEAATKVGDAIGSLADTIWQRASESNIEIEKTVKIDA